MNLPSLPRPLTSHSGFITVNKTTNANLFFWFFPAETGNVSAPVVLWLQGGPGSSSMYGLLKAELFSYSIYPTNSVPQGIV